jgi:type II restriction enzyme
MHLIMDTAVSDGLKSGSQIARRITERWGEANLYCAACESAALKRTNANTQARDFTCKDCDACYELKAGRAWNENRIPDAGYEAMMRAIKSDRVPNLLVLQYSTTSCVANLMLVPSFFFTESVIERRPPLGATARRAGWIGCNILLRAIPAQGRLRLVENGVVRDPTNVRKSFDALRPISQLPVELRGWTLDVWNILNRLGREFSLQDVYAFEGHLKELHPGNRNIRPKIRQQLQVLRDLGFLTFSGGGKYVRAL